MASLVRGTLKKKKNNPTTVQRMETERRKVVARGWGWGKGGRVSKEHTLPVTRQMRSEGLVHSVVTTAGNTVL